jgi:hypothetical protein
VISDLGVHIVQASTIDPSTHVQTVQGGAIVVVGTGFAAVLASHGDGSVTFSVSGATIVVSGAGQVAYRTLLAQGQSVAVWGP